MIKHLKGLEINSIYDFDNAFSINELLCKFWEKIEEVVNISNDSIDILNWVKDQGVSDELLKLLSTWKDDGTLDTIINSTIFNELNTKIDTFQEEVNSDLQTKNTEIDNIVKDITELNTTVDTFQEEVNTDLQTKNTEIDNIVNDINELDTKVDTFKEEVNSELQAKKIELDNVVKGINRYSELHYINNFADESSVLFKCRNGETVLVDCGEDFSSDGIYNRLKALGVTKINHFIITHFHSDHVGGYNMVFDNFVVDNVYYKPITWNMAETEIRWKTKSLHDEFVAKVKQLRINYYSLTADTTIEINDTEKIKIMNTSPYPYSNKSASTPYDVYDYNYESLMCLYTNGNIKVFLQGDCPSQVAYKNYGDTIKNVDHLQITHHGNQDNIDLNWIYAIRAKTGYYSLLSSTNIVHYKTATYTKIYRYDFNTSTSGCIIITDGGIYPTVSMIENKFSDRFLDYNGKKVYINSSGDMVENGVIINNGRKYIIKDWYKQLPPSDGWYYDSNINQSYALNSDGSIKCNQWVTSDGYNYYVDDQGIYLAGGTYKIGATDVTFDSEGRANIS